MTDRTQDRARGQWSGDGGGESMTRAELRAAVAGLRYLEGYLAMVLTRRGRRPGRRPASEGARSGGARALEP